MADDSYEKQSLRLGVFDPSTPTALRIYLRALERDLIRQPTHESVRLWAEEEGGRVAIRGWVSYPATLAAVERRLGPCQPSGCAVEIELLPSGAIMDPVQGEVLFARAGRTATGRETPEREATVVHVWAEDDLIRPIHRVRDSVLCQSETGYLGWVEGGSVSLHPVSAESGTDGPIAEGRLREWVEPWLGTPYVWGGTGREGIDCSGFSQRVLKQYGVLIPRDAHQQMLGGRLVATHDRRAPLLPGDLLFFTLADGRVGHVGVSLGGWKVAHAERPDLGIFSMNPKDPDFNEHRYNHFVSAKRYLIDPEAKVA